MKHIPLIASILLGGLFIMSAVVVLFRLVEMPPLPEGSLPSHFMAAFAPSGYMTFVKVVELLGGILVIIPKTRNLGLLFLGPVIVNILVYHQFVMKDGIFQPVQLGLIVLSAYLLWAERKAWSALISR